MDGAYSAGIRPHRLTLDGTDGTGFDATVVLTEVTGSQTFIHADLGGERIIALVHGVRRLDAGELVRLSFDPSRVLLFAPDGAAVAAPARLAA
jgi:glycerol transport system ATP-binding protein